MTVVRCDSCEKEVDCFVELSVSGRCINLGLHSIGNALSMDRYDRKFDLCTDCADKVLDFLFYDKESS